MDLDGERHACGAFEKHRFVLDAIGAEDEVGERLVRDDALAGVVGLGQVDGGGRVFRRRVLVALEGEVEKQCGRGVAAKSSAARRVDDRLAADEIVGQLARVLEVRVGLHVDDLEFRRLCAREQPERHKRHCRPSSDFARTRSNPIGFPNRDGVVHDAPLSFCLEALPRRLQPSFF